MQKKITLFIVLFVFLGTVFFCVQILGTTSFFSRISDMWQDRWTYKLQYHNNIHSDDIVIVKIDDRTLDSISKSDLGMLAFDKGVYAEIIENLFEDYAIAALGIDIVFANPSVLGVEDEQKLLRTLKKYEDRVVIASHSSGQPHPLCLYADIQHAAIDLESTERIRQFSLGNRWYSLESWCPGVDLHPKNKEEIRPFSLALLESSLNHISPFLSKKILQNISMFQQKNQEYFFIDYFSNTKNNLGTYGFQSYSFIDILEGKTQDENNIPIDLEGKIVLIGEVGTLIHDSHLTPIHSDAKMPGVEIHANIMTTLIQGKYISEMGVFQRFVLYLVCAFVLSYVVFRFSLIYSLICVVSIIFVLTLFTAILFLYGLLLESFFIIFSLILVYIFLYLYRFFISDKSKRELKKYFSLYVSPDVVEELSQNPDILNTSGENREMAILFSDIVSFTSISENMSSPVLIGLLNEYFREMTHIIHEEKGTLDKFIGDAVMCFFNAPLAIKNYNTAACRTALRQQVRLKKLREIWTQKGLPEIKIRIGIHSGPATHGNIGSTDTRLNYTIIGDSVNLASRLEGICKQYGISICVSQSVYTTEKNNFHFREIDTISVKGRQQGVTIYELIGDKNIVLPDSLQHKHTQYEAALKLYKTGAYLEAGKAWANNATDMPSRVMAERCKKILEGKASLNQGVFTMTEK